MSLEHRPVKGPIQLHRQPAAVRIASDNADSFLRDRRERGIEEAYKRGLVDGAHQAEDSARGLLEQGAQQLEDARTELQQQAGVDAVKLAVEITRHLLRSELDTGHYDLEKIVREVLNEADVGRRSCIVHLNPADKEKIAHVAFRSGTEVEADPDVPCGSVHVETPQGLLVRDLDRAIEAIAKRILGDLP